jgi:myo-inositol-1(or 4)-monophosphatase
MIDSIESIVREAGRTVRERHITSITTKGTKDNIVTSADIETEAFLKKRLTELIPGSVFIGEEGDENKLPEKGYGWIVDPIDGTANFSRGIPMVGISVALFKDGEPYIGVVYNPFTDTLFRAETGKGAFRNGVPMHVSDRPLENSLFCTAWCTYHKELSPLCFRVSERLYPICEDIRRTGTAACELSMLAAGSVDLYFEINLSPWDYAAALICVKEAGGVFGRIDGDMTYDAPGPVLAANCEENLEFLRMIVAEERDRGE